MGNVSIAIVTPRGAARPDGGEEVIFADVTFSNSYATGGDSITAADWQKLLPRDVVAAAAPFPLTAFQFVEFELGSAGQTVWCDKTNGKFKLFTSGSTESGNVDQSAVTIRGRFARGAFTAP